MRGADKSTSVAIIQQFSVLSVRKLSNDPLANCQVWPCRATGARRIDLTWEIASFDLAHEAEAGPGSDSAFPRLLSDSADCENILKAKFPMEAID